MRLEHLFDNYKSKISVHLYRLVKRVNDVQDFKTIT